MWSDDFQSLWFLKKALFVLCGGHECYAGLIFVCCEEMGVTICICLCYTMHIIVPDFCRC